MPPVKVATTDRVRVLDLALATFQKLEKDVTASEGLEDVLAQLRALEQRPLPLHRHRRLLQYILAVPECVHFSDKARLEALKILSFGAKRKDGCKVLTQNGIISVLLKVACESPHEELRSEAFCCLGTIVEKSEDFRNIVFRSEGYRDIL